MTLGDILWSAFVVTTVSVAVAYCGWVIYHNVKLTISVFRDK